MQRELRPPPSRSSRPSAGDSSIPSSRTCSFREAVQTRVHDAMRPSLPPPDSSHEQTQAAPARAAVPDVALPLARRRRVIRRAGARQAPSCRARPSREIPCSPSAWRCSRRSPRRGCAPRRPSSPARSARSPESRASPRPRLSMRRGLEAVHAREAGCPSGSGRASLARASVSPASASVAREHGVARRLAAGRSAASCSSGCPRRSGSSPCQATSLAARHRPPDLGGEAVAVERRLSP